MSDLTAGKAQLQNQLQTSNASLNAAQSERDSLKSQVASLTQQVNNLQKRQEQTRGNSQDKPPITPPPTVPQLNVAYFQFYSTDGAGNDKKGPSERFSSSALRYVLCELGGPNPVLGSRDLATGIDVRFFGPAGALRKEFQQQVRATKSQTLWTSLVLWGNDQPGTFNRGLWRVEVWSGQNKIGEKTFQVN